MTHYYEIKHIEPNYIVTVEQDEYAQSPEDWDNFGKLVHVHKRYSFGDGKVSHEEIQEICEDADNIWLPVYMYDHSGVTINTTGFSCPWDSGQVGIVYISKADAREEGCNPDTKEGVARIKELLRGHVEVWDQYLTGSVYSYTVWQVNLQALEDDSMSLQDLKKNFENYAEIVDSCHGFYGDTDYALSEGESSAKHYIQKDAEEAKEKAYWQSRDVLTA